MLSLTPPKPTLRPIPTNHHPSPRRQQPPLHFRKTPIVSSSSFSRIPSSPSPSPPREAYQPFRPPPSPLPNKYRSLDPSQRLDILRNRLGLWHDYAPLISSLSHHGFTPPSIEEITGITSVDQNRLSVASRVRDSLVSSNIDPDILSFFDAASGANLLYELRLLNASQRAAAAKYVVETNLDEKSAQDLARAIKDFPRRRLDHSWDCFLAESPADCLAYTHFRSSKEAIATEDKLAALEKAMEIAETSEAKKRIGEEIGKVSGKGEGLDEEEKLGKASVPVVRLRYGEVAEAATVVLLPVCKAIEGHEGVKEAPDFCKWEGETGVAAAEKGWGRWVVLPGWGPVLGLGGEGGVAVEFADARVLPWRVNKWEKEEGVVVVVDRKRREVGEVDDDGFYLVSGGEEGDLGVERGSKVVEKGEKEVLGAVVLVVRQPKEEEEDQLGDEDWV